MSTPPATSYDELPYDDHVFAYTQPANLATVAALHGLDPPALDHCRVLDIGFAAGSNLLPMASAYPAPSSSAWTCRHARLPPATKPSPDSALTNVSLQARDILAPTDDLGAFDYVICHGVYSWVPPPVQDRILDVIHRHLSPAGLAYLSYNTYPGWHLRGMVRDVMAFHADGVHGGPAEKTAQARAFLDFFIDALPEQNTSYASIIRHDAKLLRPSADSYVYHEYLEADNRPVYFQQFAAHAANHGLHYLAEATSTPLPGNLKPGVLDTLASLAGDRIRLEQYLDFLRCRIFRRSVLCRAPAFSPPNPPPTSGGGQGGGPASRIPMFAVSSNAKPVTEIRDLDPTAKETFAIPNDTTFTTANPLPRAILRRLWDARPTAVPFAKLRPALPDGCSAESLANELLQLYLAGIVELHLHPAAIASTAGPRPNRRAIRPSSGRCGDPKIYTLALAGTEPDPFARYLLPLLDGTRTRDDLVGILAERAAAGAFAVHDNGGQIITDPAVVRPVLAGWIEAALERLGKRRC